jgi:uncharacterized Zn finger protein (UPF0148 family)
MEKLFLDKRIVFISTPSQTVKAEHCPRCGVTTCHRLKDGEWKCVVCAIKTVEPQTVTEQRRESLLQEIAQDPGRLTDDVIEELAELDGSDTSLNNQLYDAGYPGGVY